MEHRYIIVGDYSDTDPGTFELPFRAKSATEFDRIMRKLADPPNAGIALHIHIGPGIFKTLGLRHFATTVPGPGGHGPGVSNAGDWGWFVRPDWTITGAGEGATSIQLEAWPSFDGVPLSDTSAWTVVGCSDFFPASNVTIEHLTVDGNWSNLTVHLLPPTPPPTDVALHGLFCQINGSIAYRNVTVKGIYGLASAQTEGFALGCEWSDVYGKRFIDPQEVISANRAHFESCSIHGGFGDHCVGIAALHGGPAIISGCTISSLTNLHSGAIRLMGKDILITNCFVWDCLRAIYGDTGNIIDLTVQNSRFLSNGPGPIFADSTLKADGNAVWINVRQEHVEASGQPANPDMDGVYVDVPIRPVGEQNPLFRIRLYLVKTGSTKQPPAAPASGVLIPCPFTPAAEAGGIFRAQKSALEAVFVSGLAARAYASKFQAAI